MKEVIYKPIEDESHGVDYGLWECPECGSKFFGASRAMHDKDCSKKDYTGLIYWYTSEEFDNWSKAVLNEGFAALPPLSPCGLSDYFLEQAIADDWITPDEIRQITKKYVVSINAELLPKIMEQFENFLSDRNIGD